MERGSPGRLGATDNTISFHLCKLTLGRRQLGGVKPTSLGKEGAASSLDGVLNAVERRHAG